MSKKTAEENERICSKICSKFGIVTNSHVPDKMKKEIEVEAIILGAKHPKNIVKIVSGDTN